MQKWQKKKSIDRIQLLWDLRKDSSGKIFALLHKPVYVRLEHISDSNVGKMVHMGMQHHSHHKLRVHHVFEVLFATIVTCSVVLYTRECEKLDNHGNKSHNSDDTPLDCNYCSILCPSLSDSRKTHAKNKKNTNWAKSNSWNKTVLRHFFIVYNTQRRMV